MGILDLFRGSKDERIARRFIAELRVQGETRQMRYVAAEQAIEFLDAEGKRALLSFTGNLRREIEDTPEDSHAGIYERYAKSVSGLSQEKYVSYEAVRLNLGVLLKDATYSAYIERSTGVQFPDGKGSALVWRPVAGDVIACCVEETETSLRFIRQDDLSSWQVTSDQAFADALANIAAKPVEQGMVGPAQFIVAEDSFIATRLLCVDRIRSMPWRGLPVAVVPDRDTLLLAGSEDEAGLAALAGVVERQLREAQRLISARPLVLTAAGWQAFDPPASVWQHFENLQRLLDEDIWKDFKEIYEKEFTARGEDVFVASLIVYEAKETGIHFTMVVWSNDVDTLLPVADHVVFNEGEGRPRREAPWQDVLRVMGAQIEKLDGLPERYRVTVFPTAGQFVAMGAKVT